MKIVYIDEDKGLESEFPDIEYCDDVACEFIIDENEMLKHCKQKVILFPVTQIIPSKIQV